MMKTVLRSAAVFLSLITLLLAVGIFPSADELPENLYRAEEAPEGVYYKNGSALKGQKYAATNICAVSGAGKVYAGMLDPDRNGAVPFFEFYAEDGSFLADVFAAKSEIEPASRYFAVVSAAVPEGAAGVRVNFPVFEDAPPVVTTEPFTYEEYITMTGIEKQLVRKDSPLYGKKILFCGDSICEATVEKNNPAHTQIAGWAGRIGTYNNMVFVNKGLGGAAFSYYNPEKNPTYLILTQLQSLAGEAESFDLVLLHGGVNDMWDKVPIGEISESRNPEDFDMLTFAGAMEATFCYAKKTYTNASIGFLINFETNSSWGYLGNVRKMTEYWDLAKQICEKWEIPYLDLFDIASARIPSKKIRIPTDHGGDGIHPVYDGYELLYPHIEAFAETLVPEEPPVTETPATETPVTETPVTETPATETPVTETPATGTPATGTPATETPATETPATETPVTETPATETPAENGGLSAGAKIGIACGIAAVAAGAAAAVVAVRKKKKH